MARTWMMLGLAALAGCGGNGGASGTGGHGGAAATSSHATGGAGGAPATCPKIPCTNPGEACVSGACAVDCRVTGAVPCAAGTVCDASDASPGKCVDPAAPCVTTSAPEPCGGKVCGPGAACDGNGKCYPRIPCGSVVCDAAGCYGASCACTRPAGCEPAPVGMPGDKGTLQDDAFRDGLVDLDFDPGCTAWGVTLISGPDC